MERYGVCVKGHKFKAVGEGDDPHGVGERYMMRPCPICDSPTEIKWPRERGLIVVAAEVSK